MITSVVDIMNKRHSIYRHGNIVFIDMVTC